MPSIFSQLPTFYFIGAVLIAMPVVAQAPSPSQEFWEYMEEFGDDKGDVLDPLDYEQILSMKDQEDPGASNAVLAVERESVNNRKIMNTDMKLEKKSSAQASSIAMKGATL